MKNVLIIPIYCLALYNSVISEWLYPRAVAHVFTLARNICTTHPCLCNESFARSLLIE